MYALSRGITSIKNGILRNIMNSMKKEIQKKRNIKLRKINKRKRKMLVSKAFHNTNLE